MINEYHWDNIPVLIVDCYRSECLELQPQFLGNLLRTNILLKVESGKYWLPLGSFAKRAMSLFQVARVLNRTEVGTCQAGPLVNAIRLHGDDLLGFSKDEKKMIEDGKGDFAVVAGVRRQAAYSMLALMRCLVQHWYEKTAHNKVLEDVANALCDLLVK